ncbi:MAG: hypothetical protein R2729_14310 [Bryobacteraceae bacterium]
MNNLRAKLPWMYLLIVLSVNAYIVRDAFVTESTGHLPSMHGYLMAIAERAGLDRFAPRWWPYWGGGGPLTYTYAPLTPMALAAWSKVFGVSLALAFHQITAFVFCALPAAVFVFAWRLLRAPGWGLIAALAYSLLSPTQLLAPDAVWSWEPFLRGRRLYVLFTWDDLPHLIALLLTPVAAWLFARALRSRSPRDSVAAGCVAAMMMLASMFGLILAVLSAITVALAVERRLPFRNLIQAGLVVGSAYVLVCPMVPPSLLLTIQRNSARNGEGGWSSGAAIAFAVTMAALAAAWPMAARLFDDWPRRWVVLFAVPSILIPLLDRYWNIHFLPQPSRYKFEMELSLVLLAMLAVRPWLERLPVAARAVLALALAILAGAQAISHRSQWLNENRPLDMTATAEYRAAKYLKTALPGARVMTAGGPSQWLNTFGDNPQLAWPHYPSAPNWIDHVAMFTIQSDMNAGDRAAEYSVLWMKAFGVQAIAMGGPKSPETWKAFAHLDKFEGVLEEIWQESGARIYRVPQRSPSLAHVVRPGDLASRAPIHGLDVDEVSRYVAALDDPGAPEAAFEWLDANTAAIRATVDAGRVVSVQVNHAPGWRAVANGKPANVRADALGLIVIEPECSGDCAITLRYDGGWEAKATRAGSVLLLLAVAFVFARKPANRLLDHQ